MPVLFSYSRCRKGLISSPALYVTHICCFSWRRREPAEGLELTLKPLAYACRNGGGDKGAVGGCVRKGAGKEQRVNVLVLSAGESH